MPRRQRVNTPTRDDRRRKAAQKKRENMEGDCAQLINDAIVERWPQLKARAVQEYEIEQNQRTLAEEEARQEAIRNSARIQEAQRLARERIMYGDVPDSTKRFLLRPWERELHQLFLSLPLEERQDFLDKVLAPENLTEHQLNAMNVRGFGLDPTYEGGKRKKRRKSRKRTVKRKTKSKKRKSKKRRRKRNSCIVTYFFIYLSK